MSVSSRFPASTLPVAQDLLLVRSDPHSPKKSRRLWASSVEWFVLRLGFYQDDSLILEVVLHRGQAPKLQGDGQWLDLAYQPYSEPLGRPVAFYEDSEEWGRALASCYPPGSDLEARVLEDRPDRSLSSLAGRLDRPTRQLSQLALRALVVFVVAALGFVLSDLLLTGFVAAIPIVVAIFLPVKLVAMGLLFCSILIPCWLASQLLSIGGSRLAGLCVGLLLSWAALNLTAYTTFGGLTLGTIIEESSQGDTLAYLLPLAPGLPGGAGLGEPEATSKRRVETEELRQTGAQAGLLVQWANQYHRRHGGWSSPKRLAAAFNATGQGFRLAARRGASGQWVVQVADRRRLRILLRGENYWGAVRNDWRGRLKLSEEASADVGPTPD